MPSTNEHINARDDIHLQRRLIAAAEQAGIDNAASRVATALGTLVSHTIEVNGEPTSLTALHAYAVSQTTPPPGANPAIITDAALQAAVTAVLSPTE